MSFNQDKHLINDGKITRRPVARSVPAALGVGGSGLRTLRQEGRELDPGASLTPGPCAFKAPRSPARSERKQD